jgi:peptidyl-prolyl cis-trans isomerase SurA
MKLISVLFFLLFTASGIKAQDALAGRIKIDGVSAVIGDYVILDSDVDKTILEMKSQGIDVKGISKCQLLGKLMEDKLYAHHAIQDSLEISVEEVYATVDQIIDNFTRQLGSIEKVLEFYDKEDEASFRQDIFEINKIQKLSSMMQSQIIENVEVTPEEVRVFFESIPKIDLPTFGTELEISQIVLEPEVSDDEKERIISQLRSFREDVLENGASFGSKAILYSQDPGSRATGGKYTLNRKRPQMVKEFRDEAFSLEEGEISEPFKTDFGWHILMVDKIRGQEVDVRHILLTPRIEPPNLHEAKKKLDTIRSVLLMKKLHLKTQHLAFSSEKETKFNGGVLINPQTGDTRFELTNLDPFCLVK